MVDDSLLISKYLNLWVKLNFTHQTLKAQNEELTRTSYLPMIPEGEMCGLCPMAMWGDDECFALKKKLNVEEKAGDGVTYIDYFKHKDCPKPFKGNEDA